jgi:class 3 adenylate cyclase/tetratricopeptide (TPR) repeat protein
MLFADIAGFTPLAERFDPEIVTGVVNDCFRVLGEVCHRYGGVIDKFIGDSMMVLFGAPKAHEDDPVRAIYAAIAMRRRLRTFNTEVALRLNAEDESGAQPPDQLEIHMGINTGEVIAGAVGSSRQRDYTVMGDAVNLAARLQEAAGPGEIYVSQQTHRLTRELFDYELLAPIRVKGKRGPVTVYRLLGERESAPGRWGLPGLESPLVGRRREFRLLRRRLRRLGGGDGQVVAVIGEAGIGKSRLVTEVHRSISAEPLQWAEGRCLPYGQPVSYGVIVEILRTLLGAGPEASESAVAQRLWSQLVALLPEHCDQDYAYLGHLLNLRLTEEQRAHVRYLDDRALHLQVLQAVSRFIQARAQQTPLVLVFEDLHWADAASVELLSRLIPLTAAAPLMLLWIARPERSSETWTLLEEGRIEAEGRFAEVWLDFLSESEGEELARNLLAAERGAISPVVRSLVLGRAAGNPFFMEEVLRSLLDSGALKVEDGQWHIPSGVESEVPETLRGVLMSRIDHLADEDRQILQRSAVLGRLFSYRVLQMIGPPGVDLDESLIRLQQEEMVRPRSGHGERTYIFKHVLLQEAAYDSLLLSQRRTLHRRAGEALEQIYAGQLEDKYALLTHHFDQGQVWDKAFAYAERAARRAQSTFANEEAVAYFARALDLLPRLGDGQEWQRKRFEFLAAVERIQDQTGRREGQRESLNRMASLANEVGDERLLAEAQIREGHYLWRMGDYGPSAAVLERALAGAQALGDMSLLGRALANLGVTRWFQSAFPEALSHDQDALQAARSVGDKYQECRILNNMGVVYNDLQQNEEALICHQTGLEIAEETGNLLMQGIFSNNIAHMQHDRGQFSLARVGYETALTTARLVGNRRGETVALANIADVQRHLGDYKASLASFRQSLDLDISLKNEIGQAATQGNVSNVLRILGRYGEALELAQKALASHRRLDVKDHMASDHRHLAMIYDSLGEYGRAEQHWQEFCTLSEGLGLKLAIIEAYWGLGTVALAQNEPSRALDWLHRAETLNVETQSDWNLLRIRNAQARAYRILEDLDVAKARAEEALALSEIGPSPLGRFEAQDCLVHIALAQGDSSAALKTARAIWEELQALGHVDGSEMALALTCWQAATAAGAETLADICLRWGYEVLMEQAGSLDDHPSLRRSFLENVPAHRSLLAVWGERDMGEEDGPASETDPSDD